MGLHPRQLDYAWNGDAAGRSDDRAATGTCLPFRRRRGRCRNLIAACFALAVLPTILLAQSIDTVRIATFAAPLSRDGPGLLLRDILKAEDSQIIAIAAVIDHIAPDILLLTDFDFDAGGGLH